MMASCEGGKICTRLLLLLLLCCQTGISISTDGRGGKEGRRRKKRILVVSPFALFSPFGGSSGIGVIVVVTVDRIRKNE